MASEGRSTRDHRLARAAREMSCRHMRPTHGQRAFLRTPPTVLIGHARRGRLPGRRAAAVAGNTTAKQVREDASVEERRGLEAADRADAVTRTLLVSGFGLVVAGAPLATHGAGPILALAGLVILFATAAMRRDVPRRLRDVHSSK